MSIQFPPSLNYTCQPTPIVRLRDRSGRGIWLKRDDMTGMELSGNKIRKLDFLVKEALDQGAEGIITCGGLQSNHCRAAAFVGARLGLETVLFLRGQPASMPTGNYLLDRLTGAHIIHVTPDEYKEIDRIMAEKATEYGRAGKKMYVIPEGGSNETGAWGYCQCFVETEKQIASENLPIDAIAVASGSGGTHAGLLIGKKLTGSRTAVFSINVCDDADYFTRKIAGIIDGFNRKYDRQIQIDADDIRVFDGYVGGGYGITGSREVEFIRRFIRTEGIVLDPVYTAKAFLGLEDLLDQKKLPWKNILFIHTGGLFGIFPQADLFV